MIYFEQGVILFDFRLLLPALERFSVSIERLPFRLALILQTKRTSAAWVRLLYHTSAAFDGRILARDFSFRFCFLFSFVPKRPGTTYDDTRMNDLPLWHLKVRVMFLGKENISWLAMSRQNSVLGTQNREWLTKTVARYLVA